jgi:hypothetical protein
MGLSTKRVLLSTPFLSGARICSCIYLKSQMLKARIERLKLLNFADDFGKIWGRRCVDRGAGAYSIGTLKQLLPTTPRLTYGACNETAY